MPVKNLKMNICKRHRLPPQIAGGYRDASNSAYDLGFAAGLEGQRGHLSLYGVWYEQDENFRTEFNWLIPRAVDPDGDGDIVDGSFDSGRGSPGSFRRAVTNSDGSYSPFQVGGLAPALAGRHAANGAETQGRFESVRRKRAKSVQNVAELVATREAFEWYGWPVTLAVGAQYRELAYAFEPDPLNAAGEGPQPIREFPAAAEQRTWAVFTESLTQLGERAELQLAVRHERYRHAGNSTDPKIAAQFFASDSLSLRASWGTSFQAPSSILGGCFA
ncbi:MAG: TonB-dependent receptor [Gammaproteobacteria bacterium]|nr:TonB-dependent receptor [Gammaproteobacteria bacterium]